MATGHRQAVQRLFMRIDMLPKQPLRFVDIR
jgi:hypothetical protein